MENRGLLFIPDISGFTHFVNHTEIEHSRLIIQELLEILINANQIGLEISEIEGDAILFYKFGEAPDLEKVYRQVEKMFCEFHRSLIFYEHRRFCQCEACVSAVDLTLKIITHYGEFAGYNVKSFNKLIGRDIIVAHQLLKNDIPQHEYWLITNNLLQDKRPVDFAEWMKWSDGAKQTESGEIAFHYTQLSELKNEIKPNIELHLELPSKTKMISLSREYKTDIITLFHASGDFSLRHRWLKGVRSVEEVNHLLPRVGMRCRCILENGQSIILASSYSYTPEKIEFSDTDEKQKNSSYYTLEAIDPSRTKLTLDYYIKKDFVNQLIFNLTKKRKMETDLRESMENLGELVKEIKW